MLLFLFNVLHTLCFLKLCIIHVNFRKIILVLSLKFYLNRCNSSDALQLSLSDAVHLIPGNQEENVNA
jgi:hypothetical protein